MMMKNLKKAEGLRERHARRRIPNQNPVLDNFGRDLTKAAEENRLDPIVGREKELERIAQILSRRKKNNPILIGEPGVGKSAIAEGLAEGSSNARFPGHCSTKGLSPLTLLRWLPAQNTAASLRNG